MEEVFFCIGSWFWKARHSMSLSKEIISWQLKLTSGGKSMASWEGAVDNGWEDKGSYVWLSRSSPVDGKRLTVYKVDRRELSVMIQLLTLHYWEVTSKNYFIFSSFSSGILGYNLKRGTFLKSTKTFSCSSSSTS